MSQPFYQPARQNFSSSQSMQQPQGGFGGFGGGYQMPQQNWGGGFGGGFQPSFGGGFGGFGGGFQPQQQFNPYQGGFGGGFQPQGFGGFGGGYNPMYGGIGGLGFNPMMGPQFGMPIQGFNPYQQQDGPGRGMGGFGYQPQYSPDRANESGMPMPGPTGRETFDNPRMMEMRQRQIQSGLTPLQPQQQPQQNPFEEQQRQLRTQVEALPEYQAFQSARNAYSAKQQELPELIAAQNAQRAFEGSEGYKSLQQKQQELQRMQEQQRQPMYGGIGGLGFNPMMGPQFGMPMLQGMQANSPQGRVAMGSLGGMNIQPLSAEQQQLLNQLPQQTQASPSGDSFARLAQMFSGRTPQNSSEPQRPAPPGMKWMLGYEGYSLVPEGLNTSMMG